MFSKHIFFFILIVAVLINSACSKEDHTPYFPLNEKMRWQYISTMEYTRRPVKSKFIIENMGEEKIDNESVFIKTNHIGRKTYFLQSDTAILRNPDKPSFKDINIQHENHFVLPADLKKGDKWRLESRPYVLEHAIEYEVALQTSTPAIKLSQPLFLDYELQSLQEVIEVPAGRFKNCAKIIGQGTCRMSASGGNFSGSIDVNVKHTDWFCPGVGLTKTVRTEIDPTSLIEPVTFNLELEKLTLK